MHVSLRSLTGAALACLLTASAALAADKPNILFIMSDDHAYQALSCYDGSRNETPNLDRIANEGMRFDNCFVTNSICGPCRAVILTSLYSHLNGFTRNGDRFDGSQLTYPKLLQKAGYQTAIVGKWHLESDPTGFDYWHILIGQGPYYNPPMIENGERVQHTGYTTEIITDIALDWLKEKRDPNKPFLLVYQHKAPHRDWQPGPDYLSMYDDVTIAEPPTLFDDYSHRASPASLQEMTIAKHMNERDLKLITPRNLTPEQKEKWEAAYGPKNEAFEKANLQGDELVRWKYQRYMKDYLRCVAAVDDQVGRVLDYLDETGLDKNTIVVYTSDQGFYLGEHGWYDKRWMYEESLRTPLLVRWPGVIKPGSVEEDIVLNLDFAPTLLAAAGIEAADSMQGESFLPQLKGEEVDDWRQAMYYRYYEYPGPHSVRQHYGVRDGRYKLIYYYNMDEWEFFDLKHDPREMHSVYDDPAYAEEVDRMKLLLVHLKEYYKDDDTVRGKKTPPDPKKVSLELKFHHDAPKAAPASFAPNPGSLGNRAQKAALDPAYKPLAVGAWCQPMSPDGVILAQGGGAQGFSLYLDKGRPTFAIRSAGKLWQAQAEETIGALDGTTWRHVLGVLDARGRLRVLVDGREVAAAPGGFIIQKPADGLSLACDSGSFVAEYDDAMPYHGKLADVRYYYGPLDDATLAEWLATEDGE